MSNADTVEQFTKLAAEEFIQTAVYVDDELFPQNMTSAESNVVELENFPSRTKEESQISPDSESARLIAEMSTGQSMATNASDIIKGFARKQIICSLYQPQPENGDSENDIEQICRSADIVILDWKLENLEEKDGMIAKNIIRTIVKQAIKEVPEQLRLFIVYTIETNLHEIIEEIYEELCNDLSIDKKDRMDKKDIHKLFSFKIKNCKVSLLNKPSVTNGNMNENFTVGFKDLADRSIDEFSLLVPGILEATTLQALAAISNNHRRIVSKFGENMDRGFLTHMSLSNSLDDIKSQIIPLITSEIESVLEDVLPDELIQEKVISDWLNNKWNPGEHIMKLFDSSQPDAAYEIGRELISNGLDTVWKKFRDKLKKDVKFKQIKAATESFFLKTESCRDNHNFARLLSSRTFYKEMPRILTLGTIVYSKEKDKYLLCLQPVCDSVRLSKHEKPLNFLFVELYERQTMEQKFSHVVYSLENKKIELEFKSKVYDCYSILFESSDNDKILAKSDDDGKSFFQSLEFGKLFWIDQLKTAHAQRAAETFSRTISRIGLTESEWLRLKAEGKI